MASDAGQKTLEKSGKLDETAKPGWFALRDRI